MARVGYLVCEEHDFFRSQFHRHVDEIVTEKSHVLHIPSNRREPYATFTDEIASMTPSQTPTFKELADYKIVGKYVPRRDIPQKVDGSAKFALDTRLPDMAYASVLRSPVPGHR